MAIEREDVFTFAYFGYKQRFHGSHRGTRYALEKKTVENENGEETSVIRAWIWPEPFCFEETEEEKKTSKDFEYSEQGVCAAIDWINDEISS